MDCGPGEGEANPSVIGVGDVFILVDLNRCQTAPPIITEPTIITTISGTTINVKPFLLIKFSISFSLHYFRFCNTIVKKY